MFTSNALTSPLKALMSIYFHEFTFMHKLGKFINALNIMMNKNKFNHAIAANVFYLADYDERKSLEKLNDIDLIEYMNKY